MTESEDVARQMQSANEDAYEAGYWDGKQDGYMTGFVVGGVTNICAIFGFVAWIRWAEISNWIRGIV